MVLFHVILTIYCLLSPNTTYVFVYTVANANRVGAQGMRGPVHPGGTGHAWSPLKDSGSTMAEPSYYELLGLKPGASQDSIKNAYRILAKKHHPDKNCSPDATRIFQNLNKAYQALINHDTLDTIQCKCDSDCKIAAALPDVSLLTRENTFSVTIDITDLMFLAFQEECERHHDTRPIDRGQHGVQYRFSYMSPNDTVSYGSLSLTFYPTTSRLLVQGTSYLLWVEEHLPTIYHQAECRYMKDLGSWRALARKRGIGIRRDSHTTRASQRLQAKTGSLKCDLHPDPSGHPVDLQTSISTNSSASRVLSHSDHGAPDALCLSDSSKSKVLPPDKDHRAPEVHPPTDLPVPGSPSPSDHRSPPPTDASAPEALPLSIESAAEVTPSSDNSGPSDTQKRLKSPGPSGAKVIGTADGSQKKCKKSKKTKNKSSKEAPKSSKETPKHCYVNCKHNGNPASGDMIRCTLCMLWVHVSCSGEEKNYAGAWTCKACRSVPSMVIDLQLQLSNLILLVQNMCENNETQKDELNKLKLENGNLKQKIASLEDRNCDLRKLIETMSEGQITSTCPPSLPGPARPAPGTVTHTRPSPDANPSNQPRQTRQLHNHDNGHPAAQVPAPSHDEAVPSVSTHNRFSVLADDQPAPRRQQCRRTGPSAEPVTVTVVGSSMVRGVAPLVDGNGFKATGFVYPGMTARQINARMRQIPSSDVTVLAAGSNNIETQPLEQCKEEIRQLIDNVARKRNNAVVVMSEIPKRIDKPALNNKIGIVNEYIISEIAKHKLWFLLTHDCIKSDYKDGLHFNSLGIAKYAHGIRHKIRGIMKR